MKRTISDYAVIGDGETAALVNRIGSIDLLCWPHFHSEACFAALVGNEDNGHWTITPRCTPRISRRYRDRTAILETCFKTDTGTVTLTDFMPQRESGTDKSTIVRILSGKSGRVPMRMSVALRFDYAADSLELTRPQQFD